MSIAQDFSDDTPGIQVAADIGHRLALAEAADVDLPGGDHPAGLIVRVVPDDHTLRIEDTEKLAAYPREPRGTAVLRDAASFAAYVNRLSDTHTTLWADVRPVGGGLPTITAVFNDHWSADAPGWRDHTAKLQIQWDEDWAAWISLSDKMIPQRDFATFLMDHAHNINVTRGENGRPRTDISALMLAVTKFRAQRTVEYQSHVDLTNGQATFIYDETIGQEKKRGQTLQLPDKIHLSLWPFAGSAEGEPAYDVEALLRYDTDSHGLRLGYKIVRPQEVIRIAWERVAETVGSLVGDVPMLQGVAPGALRS